MKDREELPEQPSPSRTGCASPTLGSPLPPFSHLLAHSTRLTNSARQPWRTLERQQGVEVGLWDPNSPFLGNGGPYLSGTLPHPPPSPHL